MSREANAVALYITVSTGPRADCASPIVASSDPRVVRATLRAIARLTDANTGGARQGALPPADRSPDTVQALPPQDQLHASAR